MARLDLERTKNGPFLCFKGFCPPSGMLVSGPKMMSDGQCQYHGRLSSRYISHSGKHVGHRLDFEKFGKLGA